MPAKESNQGWDLFLTLCSKIKSREEWEKICSLFFTHEERETLASRTLIIKELLAKTKTQREISQTCDVSIAQITRGSNALKGIEPTLQNRLEKILLQD